VKNEINGKGHEISTAYFGKETLIMNENSNKEQIMKDFHIFLEGTWNFNYLIEANSKEEAINQAIQDVDKYWARPLDIYHTNQWLCGEEEKRNTRPMRRPILLKVKNGGK